MVVSAHPKSKFRLIKTLDKIIRGQGNEKCNKAILHTFHDQMRTSSRKKVKRSWDVVLVSLPRENIQRGVSICWINIEDSDNESLIFFALMVTVLVFFPGEINVLFMSTNCKLSDAIRATSSLIESSLACKHSLLSEESTNLLSSFPILPMDILVLMFELLNTSATPLFEALHDRLEK